MEGEWSVLVLPTIRLFRRLVNKRVDATQRELKEEWEAYAITIYNNRKDHAHDNRREQRQGKFTPIEEQMEQVKQLKFYKKTVNKDTRCRQVLRTQ